MTTHRTVNTIEAHHHERTGGTDALIERLAQAVHARRMTVPAILFLEAHKPLTSLFHTAAVMSLPMMLPLFGAKARELPAFLQSRDNVERLVRRIEELAGEGGGG
ncbi:MAG: hypothetical protein OXF11_09830 [Deltaproteobacteria bacterium]|nr:hypothetical protein [Deltaproteobacteria bacterium]